MYLNARPMNKAGSDCKSIWLAIPERYIKKRMLTKPVFSNKFLGPFFSRVWGVGFHAKKSGMVINTLKLCIYIFFVVTGEVK